MPGFHYTLERNEVEADSEGSERDGKVPSQFHLTRGEERMFIGRSASAKGGQFLHDFGWSSASPSLRAHLGAHVRYRQSDVVVATFPKCGTTLTEQVGGRWLGRALTLVGLL